MNLLDKLLKRFKAKILQLINKEGNPRNFSLLKHDEIGKLTHLIKDIGKGNLEIIYDDQTIEVYYNSLNLINNYIQKPNITNDILIKIFEYLANHEYGHTFFCESTRTLINFCEKIKNSIFNDFNDHTRSALRDLFWIIFKILIDFYADFQAKKIDPIIPKNFLDLNFKAFEQFLNFNRNNTMAIMNSIVIDFYSNVFYSSTWFYNFDQWDYLLKKCGKNDKTESINLLFLINKIFEVNIKKKLDLDGYKQSLEQLTILLWKINYDMLFFENKIDEFITRKLEGLFHQ